MDLNREYKNFFKKQYKKNTNFEFDSDYKNFSDRESYKKSISKEIQSYIKYKTESQLPKNYKIRRSFTMQSNMGHIDIYPSFPDGELLLKIIYDLIYTEYKVIDNYTFRFGRRKTKEKKVYLDDGNNFYTELIFDC